MWFPMATYVVRWITGVSWTVISSKYKNCLQRRSFSISPEAMLRFHFQVHENQAKLWYFTNLPLLRLWDAEIPTLDFPEIRGPSSLQTSYLLGAPKTWKHHLFLLQGVPFNGWKKTPSSLQSSDWNLSSVRDSAGSSWKSASSFFSFVLCPTKTNSWLVVSTHLKNISQNGIFPK